MLTGTLGPLAQRTQTPDRPLVAVSTTSLLERPRPVAQLELPAAVARLRAAALSMALVVHQGLGQEAELNFMTAEKPTIALTMAASEMRARKPRRSPSALAEHHAVPPSRQESSTPRPDVRPLFMAIRALIETERITAARQMLAAAPAYLLDDPLMARLRPVLAPPVVRRMQKRDVDRTREYDWLRTHGREYRGRWVALVGSNLLASAPTLRELQEQLRTTDLTNPPLLHRVD